VLGPDYPREWFTMPPKALDDVLTQKLNELMEVFERQIPGQPIARIEPLRKESRARIEMFGQQAREALSMARSPVWLDEKASSGEFISELAFDASGERLFAATNRGVRVYLWSEVLDSTGEMPPPKLAVNLNPWLKETPQGTEERNSFVHALAYDNAREWLLFAGQEGRVRYLDLAAGRTGVLVEPPGRPTIGHLGLSRDRSALGITCNPDINDEGRNKRAAVIQFWDYRMICRSHS
jgi:hypothetical protein